MERDLPFLRIWAILIVLLFAPSLPSAFRIKARRLEANISEQQPPPTGTSRDDEFRRAEYCSQLATVKGCLGDEYCQALVWQSPQGMLSRHVLDHRDGPTVCCEPLQEAKEPEKEKYARNVWLDATSTKTHDKAYFSVSKNSPCIQTVCSDDGLKDWCSLKSASLCLHASGDNVPSRCKSLELFEDLPTSNVKARATMRVPGLQEALELEKKLADVDKTVEQGYDLYLAATTEAAQDLACGILSQGHTCLQSMREVGSPFVGRYIGYDEHWFYGNPNYFKDIGDNIADITAINVMITGTDVGFMSTTNLQTVSVVAWGAVLDAIVDMYRQYESGKQAARQMIPKVQQACNSMACLVEDDHAEVPIIKPLFDEYLGTAKCSPCKPFAFCQAAGDGCEDLQKAVRIISSACDIVMPRVDADKGGVKTKSWETARTAALRKDGKDYCFADGYFPGASEARGGRLSDLLGKAIQAFWSRLRLNIEPSTDVAAENQKVIDAASVAYAKVEAQCGR